MAYVREIDRNGVLYSGIMAETQSIEPNQIESIYIYIYIGKSIAIKRIEKKQDINDIPSDHMSARATDL